MVGKVLLKFLLIITPKARVIFVIFREKHQKNNAEGVSLNYEKERKEAKRSEKKRKGVKRATKRSKKDYKKAQKGH